MEVLSDLLSDLFHSEKFRNAAAILGSLYVGRLVVRELFGFVSGFRAFFLAPMGIGHLNLKKYGNWAVVTGASEGIGRGYALELARRGLNVVLMSRSEEKLNKVAAEIKEKYGRETLVIPVDFSRGYEIYAPLAKQLDSLDIGILVNNVGYAQEHGDYLTNVNPEVLYKMVQVNCQPVLQMSRILLPKMTAKGGGVIVNMSSMGALTPLTLVCVYSATKIYVNYISDGIRKEYGGKGVIVQNVMAGAVATAMAKGMTGVQKPSFWTPSPTDYAKAAITTIGIQRSTHGCFSHAILGYMVSRIIPSSVYDSISTRVFLNARKN